MTRASSPEAILAWTSGSSSRSFHIRLTTSEVTTIPTTQAGIVMARIWVRHPTIEFVVTVGEERGLVGSRHLAISRLNATHGFVLDTAGVMGSVT